MDIKRGENKIVWIKRKIWRNKRKI